MRAAKLGVPPGVPRRVLDLLITGTTFVLVLPVFVLLALLVKMTSPGPVIFRQERVGQGGVPFTMLKFRTMRTGVSGPHVTTGDDGRLTPIGRLLRFVGLDELPQLINILKGEMTLVGPRPETQDLALRYPTGCDVVFRHRPGLTGPAAVRLRDRDRLRSSTQDLEEYYLQVVVPAKVAVDLEFLAEPTLLRTFGVIVETLLYIVTGGRTRRTVPIGATAEAPSTTTSAVSS